jgi:phage terminase large subunit-like protein
MSATVDLTWKLSPIQRAFFESDAKYRTLVAGRRFGKNTVGLASQCDFAIRPHAYQYGRDENVVTWWVAPTYTQAKKYGFQTAQEMIPDRLIDGEPRRSIPFEIPLKNGSSMEFYSYSSPESLDGAGVDDMVIDERGYMADDIWNSHLSPMLLDTNGRAAFIGKAAHSEHFVECFERGQNNDDRYDSWQATSYDNPFIPDNRIDDLFGTLPERVYKREILAEFDAGGAYLTGDMLHFVDPDELNERELSWTVTADLGLEANAKKARENDTDYWAAAVVAYDSFQQEAFLVDVARTRGMTKDQGVGWLRSVMDPLPTNTVGIEANQAQRWFVQDAQDAGLKAYGIENDRSKEERLTYLSVPFANKQVRLVNHEVPDDPAQDHDPRWDEFRNEWLSFPNGSHDDLLDAVEMAVRQLNLGGTLTEIDGGHAYGDA